jgi:hypothetical protein
MPSTKRATISPLLLAVAAAFSVIVVRDAASIPRTYSTGYDGTDPGRCAYGKKGAVTVVTHSETPLLGADHNRISVVRLRRSAVCSTMWRGWCSLRPPRTS